MRFDQKEQQVQPDDGRDRQRVGGNAEQPGRPFADRAFAVAKRYIIQGLGGLREALGDIAQELPLAVSTASSLSVGISETSVRMLA